MRKGQTLRATFINRAEKSAFVDLVYKDKSVKDDRRKIGFYVFNQATPNKVFDMSAAEKVLLPQSSAKFETYLIAENWDFDFKLEYSASILGKSLIFGLAALLAFVSYF